MHTMLLRVLQKVSALAAHIALIPVVVTTTGRRDVTPSSVATTAPVVVVAVVVVAMVQVAVVVAGVGVVVVVVGHVPRHVEAKPVHALLLVVRPRARWAVTGHRRWAAQDGPSD